MSRVRRFLSYHQQFGYNDYTAYCRHVYSDLLWATLLSSPHYTLTQ